MSPRSKANLFNASVKLGDPEALHAGGRSGLYAFFAKAMTVPDEDSFQFIADKSFRDDVNRLMDTLPYELSFPGLPQRPDTSFIEFQSEYISTFDVGSKSPPCPLHEGSHRKGSSRKGIMEELVRFYNHFGLHMPDKITELPDHLVTELEFMHYLCFLEATALDKGEATEDLTLAQRDFLGRHLASWVPVLAEQAGKIGNSPFHAQVLYALNDFIKMDLSYLQDCSSKES